MDMDMQGCGDMWIPVTGMRSSMACESHGARAPS